MPAILSVAVCSLQWFAIGYTLAYGEGSGVIGDLKYAFHIGVLADPVGTIPAILFSEFQLIFEATVCAIAVGGAAERGRLLPLIPFIFVRRHFEVVKSHLRDTDQSALGDLHILPPRPYGVVRHRFPRSNRCPRLCRRHTCSYLQWRNCFGVEYLPILSNCSVS